MSKVLSETAVEDYGREGYYFPLPLLSAEEAADCRRRLEEYEDQSGGPIESNNRHKCHLLFPWLNRLVCHPRVLDAVEDIIGPNILCWSSSFFIKEARDPGFVSWHQDSTYWGLDPPDVITVWIAFSDAPVESGAMRFIPGSHRAGQLPHRDTFNEHNLLSRGQVIDGVDESRAVDVPLKAGEMSLHHIQLVHGSLPNTTPDRRIGFAIRYIPPHVRQLGVRDTATLARGQDTGGHYDPEPAPAADLDAAAVAAHKEAMQRHVANLHAGTDKTAFRK